MRERAAATIFMWITQAISTGLILTSLRYTEFVPNPEVPGDLIPQTMFVSGQWQLGAAILIFCLIAAAAGSTVAIWHSASQRAEQQTLRQTEKAKRSDRDARIKRLLATMDDEELDALEQDRLSGESDRLSLEALLRQRS
jgi:hypothetical protein